MPCRSCCWASPVHVQPACFHTKVSERRRAAGDEPAHGPSAHSATAWSLPWGRAPSSALARRSSYAKQRNCCRVAARIWRWMTRGRTRISAWRSSLEQTAAKETASSDGSRSHEPLPRCRRALPAVPAASSWSRASSLPAPAGVPGPPDVWSPLLLGPPSWKGYPPLLKAQANHNYPTRGCSLRE